MTPIAAGLRRSAGEQVVARGRRVVEGDPLARQQQRAVEPCSFSAWAPSRCASAARAWARARPRPSSASTAATAATTRSADDAGERKPQAAPGALARSPAGVEELLLDGVELRRVSGAPLERRAGARRGRARRGRAPVAPFARRGSWRCSADLGVLLEPAAQPRPLAQERLVGDLDRAGADVSRRRSARTSSTRRTSRRRPSRVRRAGRAGGRSPCRRPPRRAAAGSCGRSLLRGIQPPNASSASRATAPCTPPVRSYCAERRRRPWRSATARAARSRAAGARPGSPSTSATRRPRVRARPEPGALRRAFDRAAQLVARHRPDEHMVGAEQTRELRVGGAAGVEVGAQREHDDGAGRRGCARRGRARR